VSLFSLSLSPASQMIFSKALLLTLRTFKFPLGAVYSS